MSCKGCPEPVMKSEEKIQELVDEQLQYETDIVDNETYVHRWVSSNLGSKNSTVVRKRVSLTLNYW
ncbi:hypothetical protein J2Z83_001383 [Virgibacillus natechei]|uniref:Uncharacterized protein n=1 Tax=Virgibacillus natechei TaxID=1216297 RepID=A0ABS4IGZ1_9BACI|nr:hypothetical protein [Virgibacillus natechei]MBP1969279.1 hypothetical protein [Virgibacillus natechei]UZD12434.1 hypothetical protein OLD84_16220 [Virgibacillus natechei]